MSSGGETAAKVVDRQWEDGGRGCADWHVFWDRLDAYMSTSSYKCEARVVAGWNATSPASRFAKQVMWDSLLKLVDRGAKLFSGSREEPDGSNDCSEEAIAVPGLHRLVSFGEKAPQAGNQLRGS